ncbi:hypothetical protein GCM10028820_29370 [Tessaracoccus terricola]
MAGTDAHPTGDPVDPGILEVRRDDSGRPHLSVTFLLGRTPAPHEPIGDLVLSATVAVGLVSRLEDLAWIGVDLEVAAPVGAESSGPFGTISLATTLAGEEATRLLTALAQGRGGPILDLRARRADGMTGHWRFDFVEVLAPVVNPDPGACVHLVTVEGGVVADVLPTRPAARSRGPGDPGVLMLRKEVATPVAQVVRPRPSRTAGTFGRVEGVLKGEALLAVHFTEQAKGPILGSGPLLGDREGNRRWYLPELTLVSPTAGGEAETAPFRFDLATVGHQGDGTPGLEATVTLTLAAGPSAATLAAWEQAGKPVLEPLPCTAQVALRIPFRDEQGRSLTETIPATSVIPTGELGKEGSTLVATFRLANSWARMAYGSLSTPGFQETAPTVQVSLAHEGWRSSGKPIPHQMLEQIAGTKVLALRRAGDAARPISQSQLLSMAKAKVQLTPAISKLDHIKAGIQSWQWVHRNSAVELPAVVPCAEHGQLYRQAGEQGWEAIGCRPALQLGHAEYRTWQAETISSAEGVRVFRSLTQPGRFLVVPERYDIGRHPADDPERALQPTLLLTSTIDVENPANILCVLAAALEPVPGAADFALIREELRARTNREVELLSPAQAGLEAEVTWAIPEVRSIECLPIGVGFTVVVSTGVPGFLALKTLLRTGSVVGSARYELPGGIGFASTLRLSLGNVVGPAEGGVVAHDVGDRITLTNELGRQAAVHRVIGNGAVVATPELLLEPGTSGEIARPTGSEAPFLADFSVAPGTESLDETRSYVEDLQLGVTFIATGSFDGLAGLEVACQFLGQHDEVFTLTDQQRSREREFVLPLTAYATDPALVFTVTAVTADGTRTSAAPVTWPVRTQGVLIPLDTPTS